MRQIRYVRMFAVGAAGTLLLVGCSGTPGSSESKGKPVSQTALPVATGARAVVHTALDEKTFPVRLAVKSLTRGSQEDLDGVRVDKTLKGKIPYYLTYTVTNTGTEKIPHAYEVFRNLNVIGTDWTPAAQASTSGGFATANSPVPCEDTAPITLAPGASYTSCGTYMIPKGIGVMSVTHTAGGGFITPADQVTTWPVDGGLTAALKNTAASGDTIAVQADTGDRGGVVEVPATLKSVRKGRPSDLAGLDLNDKQHHLAPYFVTISYVNTSKRSLYPDLDVSGSVRVLTKGGQQIGGATSSILDGPDIAACPSGTSDLVPPGGKITQCTIHLTAEDDTPVAIGFVNAEDSELTGWHTTGTESVR